MLRFFLLFIFCFHFNTCTREHKCMCITIEFHTEYGVLYSACVDHAPQWRRRLGGNGKRRRHRRDRPEETGSSVRSSSSCRQVARYMTWHIQTQGYFLLVFSLMHWQANSCERAVLSNTWTYEPERFITRARFILLSMHGLKFCVFRLWFYRNRRGLWGPIFTLILPSPNVTSTSPGQWARIKSYENANGKSSTVTHGEKRKKWRNFKREINGIQYVFPHENHSEICHLRQNRSEPPEYPRFGGKYIPKLYTSKAYVYNVTWNILNKFDHQSYQTFTACRRSFWFFSMLKTVA